MHALAPVRVRALGFAGSSRIPRTFPCHSGGTIALSTADLVARWSRIAARRTPLVASAYTQGVRRDIVYARSTQNPEVHGDSTW